MEVVISRAFSEGVGREGSGEMRDVGYPTEVKRGRTRSPIEGYPSFGSDQCRILVR